MPIRFRICLFLAAALLFLGRPLPAQSVDHTRQLTRITGNLSKGQPLRQRSLTVVLKMAGDPVAVVRSRTPAIEARGAKVLAKFQHAINGIKVRATPAQIAALAKLPGVVAVKPVRTYQMDNAESVPFIGAPNAWQGLSGLHGEHIRIAVVDSGIDYTHANFGGPGTPAAHQAAFDTSTQAADPTLFGPNAPKVKGGIDLVGDAYDPNNSTVPVPDPNPLDCNGHGSHVAGTAAGFEVTASGATYHGPYDATTPNVPFTIGPGVAPLADLYAIRVFGCGLETNVIVEALDWAIAHDMQVVSMSLGASFGTEDDADVEASENAVNAGILVVAASGNDGPVPYITSSPAAGERVISVAAMDSHSSFPAEVLALSPTGNILVVDSDGIPASDGTSLGVVVLPDTTGTGSGGWYRSKT